MTSRELVPLDQDHVPSRSRRLKAAMKSFLITQGELDDDEHVERAITNLEGDLATKVEEQLGKEGVQPDQYLISFDIGDYVLADILESSIPGADKPSSPLEFTAYYTPKELGWDAFEQQLRQQGLIPPDSNSDLD